MEAKKYLGIWMDHLNAHLIDLNFKKNNHSIVSKFTFYAKEEGCNKSENIMHNKEQRIYASYYKEIADEIYKYDNVLLFGPTSAKVEFYIFLNKYLHFKDIKIGIESADKMSDNEKNAFVKNYFNK